MKQSLTKQAFRTAARVLPAALVALLALGAAAPTDDPLARALTEQMQRAAEHPDDPRVANDLGNLLALAGRSNEAEAAYRHAVELAPDQPISHYNLAQLLIDRGENLAARRELKRTLELDPGNAGAHYYLGVVYARWGLNRAARRAYVRAFELDPSLADPRHNPDVVGNRQALAAQVVTWGQETTQGPTRIYLQADRIARQARLEEKPAPDADSGAPPTPREEGTEPSTESTPPGDTGGGFARSYDAPARPADEPAAKGTSAPAPRGAATPTPQVLDASSLRRGDTVNQAMPQTSTRPRRRGTTTARPVIIAPAPQLSNDSTGRIERRLEPSEPSAFAVGG